MLNYKPYTIVTDYFVTPQKLILAKEYARLQYDMGFTLRIPLSGSNIEIIKLINELNIENDKPYTNQLEVFLPFDNRENKSFFTNMRDSDIELSKSYELFKYANDYYLPFIYSSRKECDENKLAKLICPKLQYKILYKDTKDKVACAFNLVDYKGIASDHVIVIGHDKDIKGNNPRKDFSVDRKLVNLVFTISNNLNIEVRKFKKDGRVVRVNE